MQLYKEYRPTMWDSCGLALEDKQSWLVLTQVGQNRDSGLIEQSNFSAALERLGGESDTVEVHRFGHWACGWFELILINPADGKTLSIAEEIEASLENYPVLNDDDLSSKEMNEYFRCW